MSLISIVKVDWMKLALGTVQFGVDYGITNPSGKTSSNEVKKIIDYARKQNIHMLDTSPAYGKSEEVLGKQNVDCFNIITKTAYINSDIIENHDIEEIEKGVHQSLDILGVDSIHGLLVHNVKDLYKVGNQKLYEKLMEFRERGLVKKIGVSVYERSEIETLYSKYSFDMIQLPMNVLDQRLKDGSILQELKKENIEIHVRSIFLQGLLLNEASSLPERFRGVFPLLDEYFYDLEKAGMSKMEGALKYIHDIEEIDYAVVGTTNVSQLQQISEAFNNISKNKEKRNFSMYACHDRQILDPRKW